MIFIPKKLLYFNTVSLLIKLITIYIRNENPGTTLSLETSYKAVENP